MNKKNAEQLKQLILNEIEYRKKFRAARAELESLVSPITKHVRVCNDFWNANLADVSEIVLVMDNGDSFKIKKPKQEVASVESYLPFGIDFYNCEVINVE